LGAPWELEVEDEVLGTFSSNSAEVVGAVVVQHVAGVVLQQSSGVGAASFLLPLPLLSPLFLFLCKLKCVNERERERVLVAWRCFVGG
jgi:hypothetical protein